MSDIPYRCARSRTCCRSVASTFVIRRCGSGGTGSVRCSPPRSGSGEFITDHTHSGAGTWTRGSWVSMARHISVARDVAVWTAKGDRYGSASVIPGSDECGRQCS
jgi:hypothetical protein